MDRFSPTQALEYLQEQADYFTNENYHAEASACYQVMDRVRNVTGPVTFVLATSDHTIEFIVEPEAKREYPPKFYSDCCDALKVTECPGSGDLSAICSNCKGYV